MNEVAEFIESEKTQGGTVSNKPAAPPAAKETIKTTEKKVSMQFRNPRRNSFESGDPSQLILEIKKGMQ